MGGIKSKIFSDWSFDNSELENELVGAASSYEQSKMIPNEKLNLNDFEYYIIDQDEKTHSNQLINEKLYSSSNFKEPSAVQIQVKKIESLTVPPSYSRETKSIKDININNVTIDLAEEEYLKIQQKKLRDHSLFDTTQLELNKGNQMIGK